MGSITILLSLLLMLIAGSSQLIFHQVISSPDFPRHEIQDTYNDVLNLVSKENVSSANNPAISLIDIKAINYFSNGRTLDATLWTGSPLFNNSHFYNENIADLNITYGMLVDADFNKKTGIGGADYGVLILWNNNTKSWSKLVNEFSSYDNNSGSASLRTLNTINNYSHFFEDGRRYIELSMDLNEIASPGNYRVMFFTEELKKYIPYVDFTNWLNIPPPHLELSVTPNIVSLGPGQQKNITIEVNSSKEFEPDIHLFNKSLTGDCNPPMMCLKLKDSTFHVPPEGVTTVPLYINVSQKAKPGDYRYVIYANASFSSEPFSSPKARIYLGIPFFAGVAQPVGVTSTSINATNENETDASNLLVTVPNPLSFTEQFSNFWNAFGGVVSLVAGGFAAGFSALIFDKLRKTKKGG